MGAVLYFSDPYPDEMLILRMYGYTLTYIYNPGQIDLQRNEVSNLLFITPGNPHIPGRRVIWVSTHSSWWKDKLWSNFWNSFLSQRLPVMIYVTSCNGGFEVEGVVLLGGLLRTGVTLVTMFNSPSWCY